MKQNPKKTQHADDVLSNTSRRYLSSLNGSTDGVEMGKTGHVTQQEVDLLGHVTQANSNYLLVCGFWSELFLMDGVAWKDVGRNVCFSFISMSTWVVFQALSPFVIPGSFVVI